MIGTVVGQVVTFFTNLIAAGSLAANATQDNVVGSIGNIF